MCSRFYFTISSLYFSFSSDLAEIFAEEEGEFDEDAEGDDMMA